MNEQLSRKNTIILIIISFVVLFGLIILFNLLQKKSQPQIRPTQTIISYPTPTSVPLLRTTPVKQKLPLPQSIRNAPTYAPNQGQGVNLESTLVQTSMTEIEKLAFYLPYLKEYKLSTNLTVSIVIPAKDLQDNPWTLSVQIFAIDYGVPEDSPDYQVMKTSFIEAANAVFEWMKSLGVDPQKIIIRWGDKAFIKERAEEWLASQ